MAGQGKVSMFLTWSSFCNDSGNMRTCCSKIPGPWFCTNGMMWFLTISSWCCKLVTQVTRSVWWLAQRPPPLQTVPELRQAVVQEWQNIPQKKIFLIICCGNVRMKCFQIIIDSKSISDALYILHVSSCRFDTTPWKMFTCLCIGIGGMVSNL